MNSKQRLQLLYSETLNAGYVLLAAQLSQRVVLIARHECLTRAICPRLHDPGWQYRQKGVPRSRVNGAVRSTATDSGFAKAVRAKE